MQEENIALDVTTEPLECSESSAKPKSVWAQPMAKWKLKSGVRSETLATSFVLPFSIEPVRAGAVGPEKARTGFGSRPSYGHGDPAEVSVGERGREEAADEDEEGRLKGRLKPGIECQAKPQ